MSGPTEELKNVLEPVFEELPIGILVNNVGISYEYAMFLTELPEDRLRTIIHLNCEVTAMVTKMCVPGMVERKRGAIINISSAAGIMACGDPLYDIYSASKGFVDLFSRSLATELKNKNIVVEVGFLILLMFWDIINSATLLTTSLPSSVRSARLPLSALPLPLLPNPL